MLHTKTARAHVVPSNVTKVFDNDLSGNIQSRVCSVSPKEVPLQRGLDCGFAEGLSLQRRE